MIAENSTKTAERRVVGRPFRHGQSGNPGGRPAESQQTKVGKEMLRQALPEAVQTIITVMRDPSVKPGLKLEAAEYIVDRVLGKAKQPIEAEIHEEKEPLSLSEKLAFVRKTYEDILGVAAQDDGV